MDWNWTSCFGGFWMFPLFFVLFIALMALACFGMRSRCGHGGTKADSH